ncbi:family 1 glycosylhydrolase, partial [Staphylococcus epidermidis]|uniref:family 1 glycosylhydrolase n=1 Tax=Staphylococcus epidermidis TaxID=1282 RepID=UPI00119CE6FF
PVDFQLTQRFRLNPIPISIPCSPIFPKPYPQLNQKALHYYHNLFKESHKPHLQPFLTLHHFHTPHLLHKHPHFLNRKTIHYFLHYTQFSFKHF